MVSAAAMLLTLCLPSEPVAARRMELFPWGDLFGVHRPKHRRLGPQARSVPLPRPRPADAPAPPQGTAENGTPGMSPSVPAVRPEPARPPTAEAAQTRPPAPAANAGASKEIEREAATEETGPAPPPQPSACRLALTEEIAIAPSIPDIHGPGDCGGEDLVRLEAVVLPDRRRVTLKPAAILRCGMAAEIAGWVRADIAPLAAGLGSEVSTLENFDSYECRGRNRVPGAKLSEHGHANAIDVHAFGLADGRSIVLTDPAVPRGLRETLLHSACARFPTVLGPGSDGYHEQHIHLDLISRRNNYRICEWNVYDPLPQVAPLSPAPRPDDAPSRQAQAKSEAKSEVATSDDARPHDAPPEPAKPDSAASGPPGQGQARPDPAEIDPSQSAKTRPAKTRPDKTRPDKARRPARDVPAGKRTHKPTTDEPSTKKRRASRRF